MRRKYTTKFAKKTVGKYYALCSTWAVDRIIFSIFLDTFIGTVKLSASYVDLISKERLVIVRKGHWPFLMTTLPKLINHCNMQISHNKNRPDTKFTNLYNNDNSRKRSCITLLCCVGRSRCGVALSFTHCLTFSTLPLINRNNGHYVQDTNTEYKFRTDIFSLGD